MTLLRTRFCDVSLKRKLNLIIMATTFLALVVAYSAFISYDISDAKYAKVRALKSIAQMIGYSCAASLAFDDEHDAGLTLASLAAQRDVEDAAIYYTDGRLLASYKSPHCDDSVFGCKPDSLPNTDHVEFVGSSILLFQRIENNGAQIGFVFLKADNYDLALRLQLFISIAVVLAFVSLLVAYFFAAQLQTVISAPILKLAEAARTVRITRDYSIRTPAGGHDEIGTLIEGFNNMLSEIEQREEEIRTAHGELEVRANQLQHELAVRQQAEREAATMRAYLQNVLDSMPSIVIAVNAQGRITQWNAAAEKAAMLPRAAAMNMLVSDAFPALHLEMHSVQDAIQTGKTERRERTPLSFIDEERYYDVVIYPLTMSESGGAVIRVDDCTERFRMEEMMIQTEKMMSVGGLAAGMAHEINNPLGIIVQSAQNMLRRVSPDLRKNQEVAEKTGISLTQVNGYLNERGIFQFLNDINAAGKRAAAIVTNMLNFSRRTESEHNPVNIGDLLKRSVELAANDYDLKKKYDFRHIEILWELDPALPEVPCVETKIEQVFLNLLKNAAQAIGIHGCSEVTPRIICRAYAQNEWAVIEIQDNGPGMDESVRRRIFEPFFTTKEVGTGTGLGLSVSYFIITDNHTGHIECESTPGVGSKFTIRLPLSEQTTETSHV
jgi:signal transduction histidine kinase